MDNQCTRRQTLQLLGVAGGTVALGGVASAAEMPAWIGYAGREHISFRVLYDTAESSVRVDIRNDDTTDVEITAIAAEYDGVVHGNEEGGTLPPDEIISYFFDAGLPESGTFTEFGIEHTVTENGTSTSYTDSHTSGVSWEPADDSTTDGSTTNTTDGTTDDTTTSTTSETPTEEPSFWDRLFGTSDDSGGVLDRLFGSSNSEGLVERLFGALGLGE